jgi:acyl-CoA synthetase (AMP-forming)/AMP-acid ligase II/3-oxoacyl-(acyl-carrier-protein) synthase
MEEVRSLADGLVRSAAGGQGIWLIAGDRDETFFSYRELYEDARLLLGGLAAAGVGRGDFVVLQIEEHRPFLTVFWACVLGGIVPVPLAMGSQPDHRFKVWNVWRLLRRPWLVAGGAALARLQGAAAAERPELAAELRDRSLAWEDLAGQGRAGNPAPIADIAPGDLAYLQFSSGSTGDPKGVELTHRNLLTNTADLFSALGGGPDDALLGWMPLTHDMGLIGMHLMSLLSGVRHCLMPTQLFIRRPALWLKKASEHRATILCSPNFGFHYFLSSFKPEMAAGWDLSRVRICNGGEPISAAIAERFVAALAPWGFRDGSIFPSYGLAEACVCVTTTPPWEPLAVHRLSRSSLEVGRRVEGAGAEADGVGLVDLGLPLAHCQVRIRDEEDRVLGEDYVGHVEIRGENVTRGYYGNPEATREAVSEGGWLRTGDLGFLRAGRLVVTGRAKDMVIVGGINHYLHDVERLAEEVEGLEPGRVAACGLPRPEGGGESLVLCIYWKGGWEEFAPLAERVRDHLLQRLGLAVEEVVPVRRIPKTTSGKVQRYKLARSYAAGEYDESLREIRALRESREAVHPAAAVGPGLGERALLALVRGAAEKILGAAVLVDRPLGEQGFDSQKAVALAAALSRASGVEMPVSLAFDYPTPREIARFVAGEVGRTRGLSPQSSRENRPAGAADEPIAIVGFGCRFPGGASGADGLWRVLAEGIDAVREIPAERWDAGRYYDPDPEAAGKMVTREGAFLDGIDLFDNAFFAISAPEAEALDPQQRLLLEVAWEALEHAGQDADRLQGSATGVFVGICGSDYAGKEARSGDLGRIGAYSLTGNAASTAAGRLSYVFGFEGPSVALDTACSSSLVALHLAAQSLRSGESTLALAGGVNLILTPEVHVGFSRLHAMARDGRCKTFDQAADGYGRGEGCGIVVLKRLSDAAAAGDRILALVRGSAVNQDGATNGLTAPSGEAQQRVIRQALERAAVAPAAVRYVEAHGTGTPLGDPQEARALAAVYGRDRAAGEPLLVGSIKTNVGHTEAAAGVAGLLKVVLALTREEIPPSLHFETPSPHIPWPEIPVEVPVAAIPWPRGVRPRLAGVSSFGFSGTNAHTLIEEAPDDARREPREGEERRVYLLPVSARSREALAGLLAAYRPLLEAEATGLYDLCFTAAVRRTHHPYRAALVGVSREELLAQLDQAMAEGLRGVSRHRVSLSRPGLAVGGNGARPALPGAHLPGGDGGRRGGLRAARRLAADRGSGG